MSSPYKFGLIGHSISYSKSPHILEAILAQTGIDGSYESFDVPPDQFDSSFPELIKSGVSGLSITIPFKERVIEYLDSIDEISNVLNAVNSIRVGQGKSHGFNTDSYGFTLGLEAHRGLVESRSAIIIGCGGAAAAALYSLYKDFDLREFSILGRDEARLNGFKSRFENQLTGIGIDTVAFGSTKAPPISPVIIVNCTPLGGGNLPDENPLPESLDWREARLYYDLNYNIDNRAIADAVSRGVVAVDGRKMLVGQAVQSFKLWTGIHVDFEPIFEAVFG